MANTYATTGGLIINAPITPNNVLQLPDNGTFCRCSCAPDGSFVPRTATITLATAPALQMIDKITISDNKDVAQTFLLSKQYFINDLSATALIDELAAELKAIYAQYVIGGGLLYTIAGGDLEFAGIFQLPMKPVDIYVDNVAVSWT